MNKTNRDVASIVARAFELESADARDRYLANACQDDTTARGRIDDLLAAFARAGVSQASHVISSWSSAEDYAGANSSEAIGPYKLLEPIGEGGMGIVYLAEQTKPLRRKVALKIIKPGLGSPQAVARFEAERQALALMDHPNIAKVLDAGSTSGGRPYFVMELVKGIPITEYCDRLHLPPRERLELLIAVCRAIQHAHQKGIIHRDIKPSNVLVSICDGKAVPKVIDFGVAKAIDQLLTERSLATHCGAILGTLEYMSPEQAESSALDVDTRTDIFALGVLLYELLTGTTPLERERIRLAPFSEVLRRIREEEPPSLSVRLLKTATLAKVATSRDMEPAKLARLVRGELDWIVLKALEKNRVRRYQTANDLARDLERYLAGEPVEAGPPSTGYRLRKFAWLHRTALTTACVLATTLIAATTVSTWLAIRAVRENARATQAADEAKAVCKFFEDKVLSAARPRGQQGGLGYNVKLKTAIDAAESSISARFVAQPKVEASIRDTLGTTYVRVGEFDTAIRQFERAVGLRTLELGPDHPDTLSALDHLAVAFRQSDQARKAIEILEKVLASRLQTSGRAHKDTLHATISLAAAYHEDGQIAKAISLLQRVVVDSTRLVGSEHPQTLSAMNDLAVDYKRIGRVGDALPLYEQVLKTRRAKLRPEHPQVLTSINNLAAAYQVTGRLDEAIDLFKTLAASRANVLGANHPDTLTTMSNLASAYSDARQIDKAIALYQQVLTDRRVKLSIGHHDTLRTMNNLAWAYLKASRWTEAESLLRECLDLQDKSKSDLALRFHTMSQLGAALAGQAKYAEAERFVLDGYHGLVENEPHIPAALKFRIPQAGERIVSLYEAWGKPEEAAFWRQKLKSPADEAEVEP